MAADDDEGVLLPMQMRVAQEFGVISSRTIFGIAQYFLL